MNERQSRFVAEYLKDANATQAAIRAGYAEKTAKSQGQRLMRDPRISAAVSAGQAELAERTRWTQDIIMQRLEDLYGRCSQAVPVTDKDGNPTGEWTFDSRGALRAIELAGKYTGLERSRLEVTGAGGAPFQVEFTEALISDPAAVALHSQLLVCMAQKDGNQ